MRTDTRPGNRTMAPLALTALLLTGCADDDTDTDAARETPPPSPTAVATSPAPSPTPITDEITWATCVASRADLQVSYPQPWTVRDYPDGGCAYFDPQPFDVERGSEAPEVAVRLDVESVEYDRVREGYLRGEVISQREVEVAGHPAVRIADRHTGGPLGPLGRRLTYLADLGQGKTLVLTTNETHAADPAEARDVLDRMAQRLQRAP